MEMPGGSSPSSGSPPASILAGGTEICRAGGSLPHPSAPWTACAPPSSGRPQAGPAEWLPDPPPLLLGHPPRHQAFLPVTAAGFPVGARSSSRSPPGYGVAKQPYGNPRQGLHQEALLTPSFFRAAQPRRSELCTANSALLAGANSSIPPSPKPPRVPRHSHLQPHSHWQSTAFTRQGPKGVALGFSKNSPTCSRHVGGEGACPGGRDGESFWLPGVGTSQGAMRKDPSSKRRAWPLPGCRQGALQPPLPGASRPGVGNPARCGKRSWDGGCQATLIQPLTNFQHFASAVESNQQMIKCQVPFKPVVSTCPSIHRSQGLAHGPVPGVPCKATGVPQQNPPTPPQDEPPLPAEICRGRI